MYTVHVKRVTATEARQNWFGLLDAIAGGEVVVIERHGRRIVLRREEQAEHGAAEVPDYSRILRVRDLDRADQWGWEWTADGLVPRGDPGEGA
jgi:antitoxin (DNA-binding transcriptional repressor) of toxin-antitoxin stability system